MGIFNAYGFEKKITMFSMESDTTMQIDIFCIRFYFERQLEINIQKKRLELIELEKESKIQKTVKINKKEEDEENDESIAWEALKNKFIEQDILNKTISIECN